MEIGKRDFLAGMAVAASGLAAAPAAAQGPARAVGRGGLPVDNLPGIGRGDWRNSGKQPSSVDLNYKPRRVNKVIELWEDGQAAYFTNSGILPGIDPYAQGRKMAGTYADLIIHNLEHGPLDFTAFADFMCGLKDGGPTKSGHATPAVVVQIPCSALSEDYALANSWILTNLLDLGAMGFHVGHARDPKAMEVYCQMAARYSFDYPATPKVPRQGLGLRGQAAPIAATLWGVSDNKYLHIADVWPLNPRGEILMGCSIQDTFGDANVEKILATKGLAIAEWGSSESALSVLGLAGYPEDHVSGRYALPPEQAATMKAVSDKTRAVADKNKLKFLGGPELRAGGEAGAITSREMTKRKMPV